MGLRAGDAVADLRDAIKTCVERLDRYRRPGQRVGEQNTKAMLIEPVLEALGWDLFDPDEVNREYRRRSSDNPVETTRYCCCAPRGCSWRPRAWGRISTTPGGRIRLDRYAGWYQALARHGNALPCRPYGRSWGVEVVVRPLGWLGTYGRSRTTGHWFSGRYRWHLSAGPTPPVPSMRRLRRPAWSA